MKILAGAELCRVHINAGRDDVALIPPRVDQAQMPLMQGAHRRHKADRAPACAPPHGRAHVGAAGNSL